MSITVEATYEHGTLKPVQPLDLTEGARVRLTIEDSSIPSGALRDPLADVIGICSGKHPALLRHRETRAQMAKQGDF